MWELLNLLSHKQFAAKEMEDSPSVCLFHFFFFFNQILYECLRLACFPALGQQPGGSKPSWLQKQHFNPSLILSKVLLVPPAHSHPHLPGWERLFLYLWQKTVFMSEPLTFLLFIYSSVTSWCFALYYGKTQLSEFLEILFFPSIFRCIFKLKGK